jgi:hypothetical protein
VRAGEMVRVWETREEETAAEERTARTRSA